MTAAIVIFLRYGYGVDFPRVVWACVWLDVVLLFLGAPRDIAWLLEKLS
jgi:hypothetical protein